MSGTGKRSSTGPRIVFRGRMASIFFKLMGLFLRNRRGGLIRRCPQENQANPQLITLGYQLTPLLPIEQKSPKTPNLKVPSPLHALNQLEIKS
tara:strand:- start:906 stop:1184 length:279 start_codon:yes stop_codon:yes gene_type:complete